MSLSGEEQSCAKLIQISIPTNPTSVLSIQYLIEFSTNNFLGGINIGEIVFSDDTALIILSKFIH